MRTALKHEAMTGGPTDMNARVACAPAMRARECAALAQNRMPLVLHMLQGDPHTSWRQTLATRSRMREAPRLGVYNCDLESGSR